MSHNIPDPKSPMCPALISHENLHFFQIMVMLKKSMNSVTLKQIPLFALGKRMDAGFFTLKW